MNCPTFSVIVPVWNGARSIAQALDSVLAQTRPDWEAIVVDDASTDTTADMVRAYVRRDPRVRLIERVRNGGAASARNDGLAAATGEWLVVLDDDDWMAPDRLDRLHHAATSHGADLIADDQYWVNEGEARPHGRLLDGFDRPRPCTVSAAEFVASQPIHAPAGAPLGFVKPMVRRRVIAEYGIRYDPCLRVLEDFFFMTALLEVAAPLVLLPYCGYHYLQRSGSISKNSPPAYVRACIEAHQRWLDGHADEETTDLFRLMRERAEFLRERRLPAAVVRDFARRPTAAKALHLLAHPDIVLKTVALSARRFFRRRSTGMPVRR